VWECGERQTDTQTAVTNIHFASATLTRNVIMTLRVRFYNFVITWVRLGWYFEITYNYTGLLGYRIRYVMISQ